MANAEHLALHHALRWYIDQGIDEALGDEPIDRTKMPEPPKAEPQLAANVDNTPTSMASAADLRGAAEAKKQAQALVANITTLDELKAAIENFDGLSIKKTATNMVFSDGNPEADVMLIGEAPEAEEDRQGRAFVGDAGKLLDLIVSYIGLNRSDSDPKRSLYLSTVVNWRPPGNRTPSAAELEISSIFIKKHIELVKPKFLILCGGNSAKAVLGASQTMSKLRGSFHDYSLNSEVIPTIVTYPPNHLLRTPLQKGKVWQDMLYLKQRLKAQG